jgi:NitT/TauT family transport system permease protein
MSGAAERRGALLEGQPAPRPPLGLAREGWRRILAPVAIGLLVLGGWEWLVRAREIPPYVLPGPVAIAETLVRDWGGLSASLLVTLKITALALLVAASLGMVLAVVFAQSRIIELSLFPYAVILQVTPIVAIAPLIIIWVDDVTLSLLICAWIVAFFPILSNTTVGLNSTDHNLLDLFRLYGASRWQVLWRLRLPTAMPYFLAGLRISGGLALIGAIVAEFVAGTGGRASGLAYRILESGYQLQIPRMFAALVLVSGTGVAIFLALSLLSHLLLRRWHESAMGGGERR